MEAERRDQEEEQEPEQEKEQNLDCCIRWPLATKRPPRRRDIRHVNYAFGEPKVDEAEREAQEWLDNLSIAEDEEKKRNGQPERQGLKYRTAAANQSPQMYDRLQKCQQNQEPYEIRKSKLRSEKRNESPDVYTGLHEDDSATAPASHRSLGPWITRRSALGNNSSSIWAILHPQSETGDRFIRRKPPKFSRNYLRDHRTAIAEMSALTHFYKEKEKEEEARRIASIKLWDGSKCPKMKFERRSSTCKDFVGRNMEAIAEQSMHARAIRQLPEIDRTYRENLGRVPAYLYVRKRELAEEAERRAVEDAATSFPQGRRLMSEEDRQQILEDLERRHRALIKLLKSFPLIYDTPSQIRLKTKIDQELNDIEASHSYYDNPKVYISWPGHPCKSPQTRDSNTLKVMKGTDNMRTKSLRAHKPVSAKSARGYELRSVPTLPSTQITFACVGSESSSPQSRQHTRRMKTHLFHSESGPCSRGAPR